MTKHDSNLTMHYPLTLTWFDYVDLDLGPRFDMFDLGLSFIWHGTMTFDFDLNPLTFDLYYRFYKTLLDDDLTHSSIDNSIN